MIISNNHYIELYINKQPIELESQDSLNLRVNTTLFDITKVSTSQAEWSYQFSIPATKNNNKVLDYANNLSKTNKFHTRYEAQVYADGVLLFNGSLTIKKYKNSYYQCNLVNIKINSTSEIFGEMKMTDLEWYVPFDGAPTINQVNADTSTKYYFPLIAYGVFQKEGYDNGGLTEYTPKHQLDQYNKWWVESFYPSLNVMETMRKAYESKGYNVGGTAFYDPQISEIYASCNLADGQTPIYNIGNPRFGNVHISFHWDSNLSVSSSNNFTRGEGYRNSTGAIQQTLRFPYERVSPAINASNSDADGEYNFSAVDLWNMFDTKGNANVRVTVNEDTYMFDPGEHYIVIPASGWYKITLNASASLTDANTSFKADQWTTTFKQNEEFKKREISVNRTWERCPLEIQLIRNYDDNVELIKGQNNIRFETGDPNQASYTYQGGSYTGGTFDNRVEFISDFPHQYNVYRATETNGLTLRNGQILTNYNAVGGSAGGSGTITPRPGWWETPSTPEGPGIEEFSSDGEDYGIMPLAGTIDRTGGGRTGTSIGIGGNRSNLSNGSVFGYNTTPGPKYVMPYDQSVSEAFICGLSTMSEGKASVMRNGYSWASNSARLNNIFAKVDGLQVRTYENGTTATTSTDYCENQYAFADAYCSSAGGGLMLNSYVQCCVWLEKNDIVELVAVQRDYDGQKYGTSVDGNITITAMSERSEDQLRNDLNWNYYSTTEFPKELNLFNFTNNETKVSDWIEGVQKAFNLEILQDGNSIDINTNQGINKAVQYAVKLDDRVNSEDIEAEYIEYPKEMAVKYKIDVEEYGAWLTVPSINQNDADWAKYVDSGYTVIQLNDDSYVTTSQEVQTNFSYTYYDTFTWKGVGSDGKLDGVEATVSTPVIEKYEYMAEGYGYEDAMKSDGYSLTQRFWYRAPQTSYHLWLSSWMDEYVFITTATNSKNMFNLSYKDSERSILTEYFNIHPLLASNYATVEVYLTPQEYKDIKDGALISVDSDLYYVADMRGYDPSGKNPTEIKMIKKV